MVGLLILLPNMYGQKIKIKPTKISGFEENVFASYCIDNELFICWDYLSNPFKEVKNEKGSNFFDLYRVKVDQLSKTEEPFKFNTDINTKLNQGPLCLDLETNIAYYSSNNYMDKEGQYKVELFQADYNNGDLSNPVALNIIPEEFNSAHPVIIESNKLMVFVSDHNGINGSSDLFLSKYENGKWASPTPLDILNTEFSETFPTFQDGMLYFSSNRTGGVGGLDLYTSQFKNGKFYKPRLVQKPINSKYDDFLYLKKDNKSGYISSNRKKDLDAIYYFEYELPKPDVYQEQTISFCYMFSDDNLPEDDSLVYTWHFGDGASKKGLSVKHCYVDMGQYEITCDLLDIRTNEFHENVATQNIEIETKLPIIKYIKSKDKKTVTLSVDQFFSETIYSSMYWEVNGEAFIDNVVKYPLANHSELNIKLVMWNESKEPIIIGISKTLRLR